VNGTPQDPHNLLKELKALLVKTGPAEMRFHDLRHTSFTLVLNEVGSPVKEAQRWAGHASPSTTIKIYGGEATMQMDEIVAQSLDELVPPLQVKIPLKKQRNSYRKKTDKRLEEMRRKARFYP
jgi:integrase